MARPRHFCFTWNNYNDDSFAAIARLPWKYCVYGKEVAPTTGTPHLQGYGFFDNPRLLTKIRKDLTGASVDAKYKTSTPKQCYDYCVKDGDFTEIGQRPDWTVNEDDSTKRPSIDWEGALALAQENRVSEIEASLQIRYYGNLSKIAADSPQSPLPNLDYMPGIWVWSEDSGCGKSAYPRHVLTGAYQKSTNIYWDGYVDQEYVIIEDFDRRHYSLVKDLKIWADKYSFPMRVLGRATTKMIRPAVICVTSNYRPESIWTKKQDLDPILRRFKVVEYSINKTHVR